jgi:hypothetical protein
LTSRILGRNTSEVGNKPFNAGNISGIAAWFPVDALFQSAHYLRRLAMMFLRCASRNR